MNKSLTFTFIAWLLCAPIIANALNNDNGSVVSYVTAPGGAKAYYILSLHGQDTMGNKKMEIAVGENENRIFTSLLTNQPSNSPQNNLTDFSNIELSPDGNIIYFQTSAWATSDAIHSINLKTKKVTYITNGDLDCIILGGEYQGDLVVQQHRYFVQGGGYDFLWLFNPNGKELGLVSDNTDKSKVCPLLGN
jgi:hypothetical protein